MRQAQGFQEGSRKKGAGVLLIDKLRVSALTRVGIVLGRGP